MKFPYATLFILIFSFSLYFLISGGDPYIYPISRLYVYGVSQNNWLIGGFLYPFVHIGLKHLAANMFVLAVLGSVIEQKIESKHLLLIYILSGAISGIIYTQIKTDVWVIGASSAICGLIGAGLIIDPKNTLLATVLGLYMIPIVVYPAADYIIQYTYSSQAKAISSGVSRLINLSEEARNATGKSKIVIMKRINETVKGIKIAKEEQTKLVKGVKKEAYTPAASMLHIIGGLVGLIYLAIFDRDKYNNLWRSINAIKH